MIGRPTPQAVTPAKAGVSCDLPEESPAYAGMRARMHEAHTIMEVCA
jgi:hypothetical protein